jgi:hypothetical protein
VWRVGVRSGSEDRAPSPTHCPPRSLQIPYTPAGGSVCRENPDASLRAGWPSSPEAPARVPPIRPMTTPGLRRLRLSRQSVGDATARETPGDTFRLSMEVVGHKRQHPSSAVATWFDCRDLTGASLWVKGGIRGLVCEPLSRLAAS